MTWEDDYKLSVLRACGLTIEDIKRVEMDTVYLEVTDYEGSDSYHSGCETCGSWAGSAGWVRIEVTYMIRNDGTSKARWHSKQEDHYYHEPSEVAAFFRRVMSP